MKCSDARKALSRYQDGEMSSVEMPAFEEHLAQCPECRTELATQLEVWALLGRAEPLRAPDLTAAIEARLSEPRGWAALLAGLRLRSIGQAPATAALVALSVWGGVWAARSLDGSQSSEHERPFAEFLSDAPPGMEIVALLDRIGDRP